MKQVLTGGCLCGAVRHSVETDSQIHYYCHCSDCRRYDGAAYHAAIVVSAAALKVTGETKVWVRTADSGRAVARHSCAICSTHLFGSPWPDPIRYSLKAGSLDDPTLFKPTYEIWTGSRVDWAAPDTNLTGFSAGFVGEMPSWD